MKKNLWAALVALSVAAPAPAQAQSRSNFQYVTDGAGGDMSGSTATQTYFLTFSETIEKRGSRFEGAWLDFSLCTQMPPDNSGVPGTSCIYGNGPVPITAMTKVQQGRSAPASVSITIADLTALQMFSLWGNVCRLECEDISGFPSPLRFTATMRATNHTRTDEDLSRTIERRTPDGTLTKEVVRGRTISASAMGTATIGTVRIGPDNGARTFDERSVLHSATIAKK
jgi:hypothetical protein